MGLLATRRRIRSPGWRPSKARRLTAITQEGSGPRSRLREVPGRLVFVPSGWRVVISQGRVRQPQDAAQVDAEHTAVGWNNDPNSGGRCVGCRAGRFLEPDLSGPVLTANFEAELVDARGSAPARAAVRK